MTSSPLLTGQWVPASGIPGIPAKLLQEGAFRPDPLPAHLAFPARTYRDAAHAEHMLGRLDEAAERLGVRRGLARSTQVRDAQSSANLSGVSVGLRRAMAEDLLASQEPPDSQPRGRQHETRLLHHYLRAYDHGIRRVHDGAPLDATLVTEMGAIMTDRTDSLVRDGPGWLGSPPARAYLLAAAGPHLAGLLEQWSAWVRDNDEQPRLVKMAIAHYQLEVLQPVPTANGHIARAFSALEMINTGLLRDQILPLSVWLDDHLDAYQASIRAVVDTGKIDTWVDFFATAITQQAHAQLRLIDRLQQVADELTQRLPRSGIIATVVADLVGFPVTNHRALRDRHGVSMRSATDITRRLIDLRIVTSWESRRYSQMFVCDPVMNILCLNPENSTEV